MITILCADKNSNYFKVHRAVNIFDEKRNAFTYEGTDRVIAHPPCAQWCRMKNFANKSQVNIELAAFCIDKVKKNGGILEQPAGSSMFKYFGIKHNFSFYQCIFGYPAKKHTWLFTNNVYMLPLPVFKVHPGMQFKSNIQMTSTMRARMPVSLCEYLIDSVSL